ncbi:MAG: hypothetical protein WBA84_11395 [Carnobacterium sp.]|uniref:hypothetical protein n=1 Tax=Carnobacterium sp. TaxID=48221 RepID=UPI003C786C98
MKMMISKSSLTDLCIKQLKNLLIFNEDNELEILKSSIDIALKKVENNFNRNNIKYYSEKDRPLFNAFNSDQYTVFLYYLSNTIWKEGNPNLLADRIYYLNKILHSVDLFYEVNLPDYFVLSHPLGSVIGRGVYSNYFFFGQNCTVGGNKGFSPFFDERVALLSGSKVVGNSRIGNNCIISANAYVKDTDIPNNSIVFGTSPNLIIKNQPKEYFESYFSNLFHNYCD